MAANKMAPINLEFMKTSLYAATHNDCLTEKPIQIKIVCGGLCVLELLSARLAAADNEHHPESPIPAAAANGSAQVKPDQPDTAISRPPSNSQ
jgi:hypothetical protein